jgi:flagellar protein FlgJ
MAALHALTAPTLAPSALAPSALAASALGASAVGASSLGVSRKAALDASAGSGADAAAFKTRARTTAVNFEAQFLNSMFSQMFAGIQGDGPFGGGPAVGVWRSFLSEQYAKSFAKAGGIGIADKVYHTLLAHQEARAR